MDELLIGPFIDYINGIRKKSVIDKDSINIKQEIISDALFDIMDKKTSIKCDVGTGSSTYNNPNKKEITVIDYENFINQFPKASQKNIKRCDFIAYTANEKSIFILNELSQSKSAKNKINDARLQLGNAVLHLSRVKETNDFILKFDERICYFSNKEELVQTPNNMANAFNLVNNILPDPIVHGYQPINKYGYTLLETPNINID